MAGLLRYDVPDGPENKYEYVARHLEKRIREGELSPGGRLPNERVLAAEYGVSVGTAKRAVRIVAGKGLVTIARSKGVYIADRENWA